MKEKGMLLTIHCQKSGLDIETCTLAMWQLWFGAGLLLLNFSRYIQLHIFNLAFVPGMTSYEFPALRQCKPLCIIIKSKPTEK
jgi:hypothetical protein